jgi:hypothetical protein
MLRKKGMWLTIGFFLIILGFLSLIVAFIGLEFKFFAWMEVFGSLTSFLIKVAMVLGGFISVAIANTNWDEGNEVK